jgi:hypothetical protein
MLVQLLGVPLLDHVIRNMRLTQSGESPTLSVMSSQPSDGVGCCDC